MCPVGEEPCEEPTPLFGLHSTLFWPWGRHSLVPFVTDAKKKRRKPKLKKPEPILLRDRSTSPCLPPTLLPPPPLPSPATTMASVVAPSPPVYTMPRVFGPFPPLPSKSVSELIPRSTWSWEGQALPLCSEPPQRLSRAHGSNCQNFVLSGRTLSGDKILGGMLVD